MALQIRSGHTVEHLLKAVNDGDILTPEENVERDTEETKPLVLPPIVDVVTDDKTRLPLIKDFGWILRETNCGEGNADRKVERSSVCIDIKPS